jgi:predicted MFS family arabinose efflux permease
MHTVDPRLMRPYRWAVLAAYVGVMAVQQMLWLNFAPILLQVQERYHVSEARAGLLIFVFPLLYVLLSIPAGLMVDRRGYRYTVGLGAVVTAVFAAVRIYDQSFWALFVGQLGIAAMQPYVVNGISKLVADWFDEAQGAIATGLGTVGMFLGMALAMVTTPLLFDGVGMRWTMVFFFAIAAVAAVAFVALARDNRPLEELRDGGADVRFAPLVRLRGMVPLLVVSFVGLGAFNGLTTWLEGILAPHGIDSEGAGMIGGVLIVGGIVGAVVVPLLSDLLRRRKPFLIACAVASAALMPLVGFLPSYRGLLIAGAVLGFAIMPALALLLDMSAQLAGAAHAGAATGLVMLAGNAGGTLVIVLVELIHQQTGSYGSGVVFLSLLVAGGALTAFAAPETYPDDRPSPS